MPPQTCFSLSWLILLSNESFCTGVWVGVALLKSGRSRIFSMMKVSTSMIDSALPDIKHTRSAVPS